MSNPQTKSVLGKGLASLLPPVQPAAPAQAEPAKEPIKEPAKTEAPKAEEVSSKQAAPAPSSTSATPAGAVQAGPVTPAPSTAPSSTTSSAPASSVGPVLTVNKDRTPGIALLDVSEIKANEFQPRRDFDTQALEELAQSIRENGLIQPLVVRKSADGYELIAGERRLRASKLAGLKMVPVVVRKSTDRESLELAIVENIQREDLNCVDEALAYFRLMQEFQLSQEDLAKKMGKDRATIANALRVLKLSDFILVELKRGTLSRGHAKALLSVEDVADREKLAREVLEKSLSVRQTEKVAQEKKSQAQNSGNSFQKPSTPVVDPELARLTQDLTRRFMSKVEIKGSPKNGQIVIQYASKEELYRVVGTLLGE